MSNARRPAVFLDRDGTLIEEVAYPRDPDSVRLLEGVVEALAAFRRAGFALVVVSNQSGIGRGLVTREEANAVHERFVDELRVRGIELDDVRYCPHAPEDACACRKPSAELLIASARYLGIDLAASFMIGDKAADVAAGRAAGCRTLLLGRADGHGATYVAPNWNQAVEHLLGVTT
jgi:D-glycero-D-manno-heptose 1,7-bisphosphate phosphatase